MEKLRRKPYATSHEFLSRLVVNAMVTEEALINFHYVDFPPRTIHTKSHVVETLHKLIGSTKPKMNVKEFQELVSYHYDRYMEYLTSSHLIYVNDSNDTNHLTLDKHASLPWFQERGICDNWD